MCIRDSHVTRLARERQDYDGGVEQAGMAWVGEPRAVGFVLPEQRRFIVLKDDESPTLGVPGGRRMRCHFQGSLERAGAHGDLEETAAHPPPGDNVF